MVSPYPRRRLCTPPERPSAYLSQPESSPATPPQQTFTTALLTSITTRPIKLSNTSEVASPSTLTGPTSLPPPTQPSRWTSSVYPTDGSHSNRPCWLPTPSSAGGQASFSSSPPSPATWSRNGMSNWIASSNSKATYPTPAHRPSFTLLKAKEG